MTIESGETVGHEESDKHKVADPSGRYFRGMRLAEILWMALKRAKAIKNAHPLIVTSLRNV